MQPYIALSLCLVLTLPQCLSLAAETSSCPGTTAVINATHQDDEEIACEAVHMTLKLLTRYELETPPRLDIEVVNRFQDIHASQRFGQFDPFAGKILVMSSRADRLASNGWKPFGLAITRPLYRSLIVHELAHAVADWNFKIAEPGILAHEYLAYVFQIASMPPTLQQIIFEQIDVPAFQHTSEINEIYYGLNPDYFGVKSYRHFLQTKDKIALIRRLLAGELLP
jgi:hypothetical protein